MTSTAITQTQTSENSARIERAYEAFSRGDVKTVFETLAPDIVWHVPGRSPLSGDHRGHAAVRAFFERFMQLSDGTFRLQVDNILAGGNQVVVLCTASARRGTRSWSSAEVHVWTVENGKATAFREYQGDQSEEDEFWGS